MNHPAPPPTSAPPPRHGFRFPSKRALAWLCALALILSTLPLYLLAFYNHPYYDDFSFAADAHAAWQETHRLGPVLRAALHSAQTVRHTWQGTYTGTLLSNVQPLVFSESLYFLATLILLTTFLLCFGFFLKAVFGDLLGLDRPSLVILISLALTLLVQLLPYPNETFYWFNGGVGNTFIYSLLALSLGLCVKLERGGRPVGNALRVALLALLMVLLGGGSYGGGLFGLLIYGGLTGWAFLRKRPSAWRYALLTLVFLGCFLYSVTAPGNAVRAGYIGVSVSPLKAVAQSLYYGLSLAGGYLGLPLLAVTGLLLPLFLAAARNSRLAFAHPWLWLLAGTCLFCAQLTPPLFSGVFIGGGRTVDTYWQSFVVLWLLYCFYLTGHVLRRWEKAGRPLPRISLTARRALLTACLAALLVGCMGFHRSGGPDYGVANLSGVSAARSLLLGEAAQYHREMTAREALLTDPSQKEVTLAPLTVAPDLFMKDLLVPGAAYDVRPALCAYYDKTAIDVAGEGQPIAE